jgi:hypothetical protein
MNDFPDAMSSRRHGCPTMVLPISWEDTEPEYGSPSKNLSLKRRQKPDGLRYDDPSRWTSYTVKKYLLLLALLASYLGVRIALSPGQLRTYGFTLESIHIQNLSLPNTATTPPSLGGAPTLALLYPPGLLGGYRNQVLRFIAFVVHAKENNISQLLLPSLLWSTQIYDPGISSNRSEFVESDMHWFPIPFSWVFDVDYWNNYSNRLPILVDYSQLLPFRTDCWLRPSEVDSLVHLSNETASILLNPRTNSHVYHYNFSSPLSLSAAGSRRSLIVNHLQRAALLQGMIRPIAMDVSIPLISGDRVDNPRSTDFSPFTKNCTNPFVYGGGTKAGILWNDYLSYKKRSPSGSEPWNVSSAATDAWLYRALRPAKVWRNVAEECVARHARTGMYIALHARLELEMMGHPCGAGMEKNFSRILEYVYDLYKDGLENSSLSGLFIAVSRSGMEERGTRLYSRFRSFADENLQTLNRVTQPGHGNVLPVFECGEEALRQYYLSNPAAPDHGSLLQSVINFYIAVSSHVFIGVSGSSYSTDVMTTRYWLGKGATNYRYTHDGIAPVENGGLPLPHSNCRSKKKKDN